MIELQRGQSLLNETYKPQRERRCNLIKCLGFHDIWFIYISLCFTSLLVKRISHLGACIPNCSVASDSCHAMDCSPSGSSVHGLSQARILEWVAVFPSRRFSQPRDRTCIDRQILYHWAMWEAPKICEFDLFPKLLCSANNHLSLFSLPEGPHFTVVL